MAKQPFLMGYIGRLLSGQSKSENRSFNVEAYSTKLGPIRRSGAFREAQLQEWPGPESVRLLGPHSADSQGAARQSFTPKATVSMTHVRCFPSQEPWLKDGSRLPGDRAAMKCRTLWALGVLSFCRATAIDPSQLRGSLAQAGPLTHGW